MKYSFRLYSTGPKTGIKGNWGLPLNLQACPECKTLNHKMATLCSKCGHALSTPGIAGSNPVASTTPDGAPVAVAEHQDLNQNKTATVQEQIPDADSPSIATTSNASASQAAPTPSLPSPDMLMANRRFVMSSGQKWLRRTWGVALLAYVVITGLLVVFSLQPSPPPTRATINSGNNTDVGVVIPPPPEPVPAAAEQATMPVIADQELAAPDPAIAPAATPVLAEPERQVPTLAPQSPHVAPPRTAKLKNKKIARTIRKPARIHARKMAPAASKIPKAPLPRPREPAAPAKTPCSEAARALALCNTNGN